MKKVLIVASVVSFIEWFNKENIEYLKDNLNCEVHIACNFNYLKDTDRLRTKEYIKKIKEEGVLLHHIHFAREPINKENIRAYRQLKKIMDKSRFDLIHCHTPTASIITRIAARNTRKKGTIVMYTCHGFHFHNAAPKKNWLLYYPVEYFCSFLCDYIVTINKEDYNRVKKFHTKNIRYIPGVGVDITRFKNTRIDREAYRTSIGIPKDSFVIISIGELIQRKNHEVIIRALSKLRDRHIFYLICGKGVLKDRLKKLTVHLGLAENVIFLGFRKDIPELCQASDIGALPSKIEGLGLAGIESMAAGLPLVASNVHGILDYVKNGKTGFVCNPNDIEGFAKAISQLVNDPKLRNNMRTNCMEAVKPFELRNALRVMWNIYDEIINN